MSEWSCSHTYFKHSFPTKRYKVTYKVANFLITKYKDTMPDVYEFIREIKPQTKVCAENMHMKERPIILVRKGQNIERIPRYKVYYKRNGRQIEKEEERFPVHILEDPLNTNVFLVKRDKLDSFNYRVKNEKNRAIGKSFEVMPTGERLGIDYVPKSKTVRPVIEKPKVVPRDTMKVLFGKGRRETKLDPNSPEYLKFLILKSRIGGDDAKIIRFIIENPSHTISQLEKKWNG